MDKTSIAFLIMNMDNKGGTERVTSMIANALSDVYNVYIFSCREGENPHFSIASSVKCESLHGENISNPIQRKISVYKRLKNKIKSLHINVAVAVDVALYLYLYPLQREKLCKCISWEHFNCSYTPNKLVKIGRWLSAKNADCMVVLGKNDLGSYKRRYSRIKRIEYIYNPVALNSNTHANMHNKNVIAAGRLVQQKGFDLLIDIWAKIEPSFDDWNLNIYGDGPLKEDLIKQIGALNLHNVHLKGYANDIEKEFLKSSIFVLSSRYEGFVLVLIEAQAKGLPCVSFNCKEGPAEIIDDGVNGYLVQMGDIDAFSEKLKTLMSSTELRQKFSNSANKDLERFDVKEVRKQWIMTIESL